MAEFVNQCLAQIKSELEPIKFLSLEEKRKILKKRERLEYRIRKKKREEKDFLLYIEYEQDVLKFFKMRKKARQVKSRDEVPVIKRIHQLYQLCETRFPQSREVWLDHIDFCKKQKEYSRVGRIFTQMLRTHNSEPELWVKAAQWEIEQSNINEARSLMQRCVNANSSSTYAWVQFYKLELQISNLKGGESADLAQVVFRHACLQCPENFELLMGMLDEADKLSSQKEQRKEMVAQLREKFSHVPEVWDYLARRLLPAKNKRMKRLLEAREEQFFRTYEDALKHIPTSEMWTLYLTAGLDLLAAPVPDSDRFQKRMERTLKMFQTAADQECLEMTMFTQWVALLQQAGQGDKVAEVCDLMVERFPGNTQAWIQQLQHLMSTLASPQLVLACLEKAVAALHEKETWFLWEPALLYLSAADYPQWESLMERPCGSLSRDLGVPARQFFLKWTSVYKGIDGAREVFDKYKSFPVSLDFVLEYVKQELMEDKVKMKKVRRAFEHALTDFGKTHPEVWCQYMEVEEKYGDPLKASSLGIRALVNLPKGPLQDRLSQLRSGL